MFRIIAIRPLSGCYEYIRKCLHKGAFYYFCDYFKIADNGEISLNKGRSVYIPDLFKINGGHPHINLTAIVGKNGDGKSSIVELMLRLINNYTANVEGLTHEDVNPTVIIKGVAAELYFQVNEAVYLMRDKNGTGRVQLQKVAIAYRDREVKMLSHPDDVTKSGELPGNFFYTMVSNFSHYAYNIYDFRKEWVPARGKYSSDNERCWLYYIFHKNDGYRSPLVLNPYRDKGNIDVNNEAYLSSQRLISLFLDADMPKVGESSFRQLYGKTAKYVSLTDPGMSKLQQKAIIEHFAYCKKDKLLEKAIIMAREMTKDEMTLEKNKKDLLRQLILIQTAWIHSNEVLLDAIKEWDKDIRDRAEGVYEDAGILSDDSDFATLLGEVERLRFGKDTDEDEIDRKRLIDGFQEYRMFNLAQLQQIGMIRNVCELMAGRIESFYPGEDTFDLTMAEIARPYSELSRKQKCEHYIIYKIIAIFETYVDDYHKPCRGYKSSLIGQKEVPESLISAAINALWTDIKEKPSHINLKLRQALYYLKNSLRENGTDLYVDIDFKTGEESMMVADKLDGNTAKAEKQERLVLPLDALKVAIPDTKNLEQMPPPFYQTDVVFVPDDRTDEVITMDMLSSGERQRLNSLSSIIYHLRNLNSKKEEDIKYRNVNIVLEEIELYFHPECQRMFIKEMIEMIERANLEDIDNINILFVTHSPFILSDIPKGNVMMLENGEQVVGEKAKRLRTFCANIFQMLDTGFFMEEGAIGEFAKTYIAKIVTALNMWSNQLYGGFVEGRVLEAYPKGKIRCMIDLIDDRIIRESLMEKYEDLFAESDVDMEIARLRSQIEYLENKRRK